MIYPCGDSHNRITEGQPGFAKVENFYYGTTAHNLLNPHSTSGMRNRILTLAETLIPGEDEFLFSFGEIDCRVHFYRQHMLTGKSFPELIEATAQRYVQFVEEIQAMGFQVWILGVPPCGTQGNVYEFDYYPPPDTQIQIFRGFNTRLREICMEKGLLYLDMYSKCVNEHGTIKEGYARDSIHLDYWTFDIMLGLMEEARRKLPGDHSPINVTRTALPEVERLLPYLHNIWNRNWVTNDGPLVQQLERALRGHFEDGCQVVVVDNGTSALMLALKALGLEGEVITTPFTFVATTNAIVWAGLTPVFADICPSTYNIDPLCIEDKITDKTSAILAVNVFGNPCNDPVLTHIAKRHNLKLIYDSAQAFGVKDSPLGDVATYSFHATKVFTSIEGGAVVVRDQEIADKLGLLRNHGIVNAESIGAVGINAKMNELCATVGLLNLPRVPQYVRQREELYNLYLAELSRMEDITFQHLTTDRYNYAYMPILLSTREKRDEVYTRLKEINCNSRKYFYPLASSYIQPELTFPVATDISERVLCLPLYPELDKSIASDICGFIGEILRGGLW